MASTLFDTRELACKLERAGFEPQQARGASAALAEAMASGGAARDELTGLRRGMREDVAGLRRGMREGLAAVRRGIHDSQAGLRRDMEAGFAAVDARFSVRELRIER